MLLRRRVRIVGKALVIEIVDQPRGAPPLLVLSELPCVRSHRTLHRQHVLAQRIAGSVLVHQREGFFPRRKFVAHVESSVSVLSSVPSLAAPSAKRSGCQRPAVQFLFTTLTSCPADSVSACLPRVRNL